MIQRRNIGLYIILSIITCGIFSLYWMYTLAEDLNTASQEPGTSGGLVILFSIITCGIYSFYWLYKAGEKIKIAQIKRNNPYPNDQGVTFLILAVFGLSIVSYAIIQSELNKLANVNDFDNM